MIDPDAALVYRDFVVERHRIWELRQQGAPGPWTDEPVLRTRKFTNVFRVLDYGSQWLLKELLEPGLSYADTLMRCFLYRHTNLPSAWEAWRDHVGSYPTIDDLPELAVFWHDYRALLGERVFSGAYMIYPQSAEKGTDKVESVVGLTRRLFEEDSPDCVIPEFAAASSQAERFAVLRRNKGVADFMSMQTLTDFGYSEAGGELGDLENDFVVAGPGARRGAAIIAPGWSPNDVIDWCQEAILADPGYPELYIDEEHSRVPSAMDIQNTLCEFSKYARMATKPIPSRPYQPAHPGRQEPPVLPKHWT